MECVASWLAVQQWGVERELGNRPTHHFSDHSLLNP